MHDSSLNRKFDRQPLALTILLVAAGITILLRLLPLDVRPWNLAPAGAMFLFAGARSRSWWLLLIPLAAAAVVDLFFLVRQNSPLPFPSYLAFALYTLLGWGLLRRSESPVAILASALMGTLGFFLITNTAFWLEMAINPSLHAGNYYYCEADLNGLLRCYEQALPFSKGTFFGDLVFSVAFFGAFAWLSRTHFVDERVAKVVVSRDESMWDE